MPRLFIFLMHFRFTLERINDIICNIALDKRNIITHERTRAISFCNQIYTRLTWFQNITYCKLWSRAYIDGKSNSLFVIWTMKKSQPNVKCFINAQYDLQSILSKLVLLSTWKQTQIKLLVSKRNMKQSVRFYYDYILYINTT